MKTRPNGIKYLNAYYQAPCKCNSQSATLMRLFTNLTTDGPFLRAYPQDDGRYWNQMQKVSATFKDWFKPRRLQPNSLIDTALSMDKVAAIDLELDEMGLGFTMRNPKKYQQVYNELCDYYNSAQPIPGVFVPPRHRLRKYAKVRCFSKAEMLTKPWPRNVSPRHPKFNLIWGQYVRAVEHELFEKLTANSHFAKYCDVKTTDFANRWIFKGLSRTQQGILLDLKYKLFRKLYGVDPVCISTDCSGFDGHCTPELMQWAYSVIKSAFSGADHKTHIDNILSQLKINRVLSVGIAALWSAALMSGDIHTALVACIIIIGLTVTSAIVARIRRFDIVCGGDDTMVLVHPDDAECMRRVMHDVFNSKGQELKIESIATNIRGVTFCQTRPIPVNIQGLGETHVMVQDPHRVFGQMGSHRHCRTAKDAQNFYDQLLLSYSIVYGFIPMYSSLAPTRRPTPVPAINPGMRQEIKLARKFKVLPTQETAVAFCSAFDWDWEIYHSNLGPMPALDPHTGIHRQSNLNAVLRQANVV